MASPDSRVEILLFGLVLVGSAYFHQGGGWNQNVRFALVRAIVEGRTFVIDSYLIYGRRAEDAAGLVRVPLRDATFERNGTTYAVAWPKPGWLGRFRRTRSVSTRAGITASQRRQAPRPPSIRSISASCSFRRAGSAWFRSSSSRAVSGA